MHTCTTFFGVLMGQNRKVASFAFWSTLALPNRPSRTFSYVYDVFACSESSKSTFCAFGPDLVKSRRGPPRLPRCDLTCPPATSARVVFTPQEPCGLHTPGARRLPRCEGGGTPRPFPQTPLRYQGKYWASLFQYLPEISPLLETVVIYPCCGRAATA